MNIPVFTYVKFVETEGDADGFLTSAMQYFLDELIQSLQDSLSDNGWTFPPITATELTNISPAMPDGTGWYESDANEIVFKVNGVLRKVTTTAYP